MPVSHEEHQRYQSWRRDVAHLVTLAEKMKLYETVERAKALLLYGDRQIEKEETHDLSGLRRDMTRELHIRENGVKACFNHEVFRAKQLHS